jgi:crotonobetainyl-CoA:carnitine CoA-transferase CaiB-like acyl-CoA transferase
MALFDVQVSMLANQASSYLATGLPPGRLGNAHPSLAPYELLPTATENLVVAVGNDRQFATLCTILGVPDIASDPRFAANAGRVDNREALIALLSPALCMRGAEEWSQMLEAAGVPCGPVRTIDEVFEDPQALARELVVDQISDHLAAPVRTVASPIRLSRTPVSYRLAPPALGEHTDLVLSSRLGLAGDMLAALRSSGVIG